MEIRKRWQRAIVQCILLLFAAVSIFPLVWMCSTSLKSRSEVYMSRSLIPEQLHFENYRKAWIDGSFRVYFKNTVFYAVVIVACIVVVSTLAAYGFARLKMPLKNFFFGCFLVIMMIPVPGSFIPLYTILVKIGISGTRIGYILPMVNSGLATAIFILKGYFEEIPRELEESAVIDGASRFQIYRKISLPLAMPAVSTIVILNAMSVWNEYILATVNFSDKALMPVQQGLFVFQGQYFTQYELLMAANMITVLPIILIYLCMQKYIVAGLTVGAVKG